MNKEEFNELIDGWDTLEYEQNNVTAFQTPEEQKNRKNRENFYKNTYPDQFLSKYFLIITDSEQIV